MHFDGSGSLFRPLRDALVDQMVAPAAEIERPQLFLGVSELSSSKTFPPSAQIGALGALTSFTPLPHQIVAARIVVVEELAAEAQDRLRSD